MEHEETKIEKVENGYLITHHIWKEETCANRETKYIAENLEDILRIIKEIKTDYSNMEGYCLGEKDCTFPDNNHDKHPKG